MKTVAALSLLAGSALAFAPQQAGKTSSAVSASFEDALGAQPPLGFWYVFFLSFFLQLLTPIL